MNQDVAINQYKQHTGNIGDIHFKRIGNNVVDVFPGGEGFATPSRLRLVRGVWTHVTGPKLAVKDYKTVVNAL